MLSQDRSALKEALAQPGIITHLASVSVEAELAVEELQAYSELAKEVGFRPAALIKEEAISFLHEIHQEIFHYNWVKLYLDKKLGKKPSQNDNKHTWGWCPLRESDMRKSDLPFFGDVVAYSSDNGQIQFNRRYHLVIPFPILDLVRNLSQKVPGLHFFVSDIVQAKDHKNDPFLAITTPRLHEMVVIAKWDEPSFRA